MGGGGRNELTAGKSAVCCMGMGALGAGADSRRGDDGPGPRIADRTCGRGCRVEIERL